jgi:hypothetical protein
MKKRILAAAILIISAGLLVYFWLSPGARTNSPPPKDKLSQDAVVAKALARQDSNTTAIIESNFARVQPPAGGPASRVLGVSPAPAGQPLPLQFSNAPPAIVLENMGRAIRRYGAMFGGNPVGTNPEITRQLSGNNPKHINFLEAEAGMRVNENGELVDPWGTPYFFHQLSGQEMEIRSAGADGKMWTADDLLAH